jgi:hypothetical protein
MSAIAEELGLSVFGVSRQIARAEEAKRQDLFLLLRFARSARRGSVGVWTSWSLRPPYCGDA